MRSSRRNGTSGLLIATVVLGMVFTALGTPTKSSAATADVSGTLRFYGAAFEAAHRNGVLRAGFVDFRSSNGVVSRVVVPKSGKFSANLASGTYTAIGRLAHSNLWCSVGADRPFRIVIGSDLNIRVDCVAI
jgi:hypothetical protein